MQAQNNTTGIIPQHHDETAAQLPVYDFQNKITYAVDYHQVTIIVAETGAGKSTQVPQYLARHGYEKIIVTQPRILAARNLARRVRQEWTMYTGRDDDEVVGYRTAHERDDGPGTKILYCTDGLQLVREITGAGTSARQILVLDEVHEWNENMEVLIAWAKKRCQEDSRFKVVIMSATIEADKLAEYYNAPKPIVVPGRLHEVTWRRGRDIVNAIEKKLSAKQAYNILVFLPGKAEIEAVANTIKDAAAKQRVPVIPLHSQLDAEAQQLAFRPYPQGKIVLATNVAQTSVTIDDIDVVIDAGLERRSEVQNGVEGLFIAQVSQADCLQRAGRAGRTKKGEYILAPLDSMPCLNFDDRARYPVPEILRKHIDRLVLRLANVNLDIEELDFYHEPGRTAIKTAKQTLRTLGAIGASGEVTATGRQMERFPVESSYARMLVEAQQYDVSLQTKLAAIIAIQEVGGITRGGTRYTGWKRLTQETRSDLLAEYDVFLALEALHEEDYEELGIIAKNADKAQEIFERLARDIGCSSTVLTPIEPTEREPLLRSIVAGQIGQIWVVSDNNEAVHIITKQRRELSSSSVVVQPKLIVGTPFDLQIPTAKGLETLHLVQAISAVNPSWLEALAPHLFSVQPGKIYYDPYTKNLAMRQLVRLNGKLIEGISSVVVTATPRNKQLFFELYTKWMHDKLDRDRRIMQHNYRRKLPVVTLRDVREKARPMVDGVVSLNGLPAEIRKKLRKLSDIKTYVDEQLLSKVSYERRRGYDGKHGRRPWQSRHKRKYSRNYKTE